MEYPCNHCCRVAAPENCENKNCRLWQQWYLHRWEETRALWLRGTPLEPMQRQAPDPCDHCVCPRQLCLVPCQAKQAWQREMWS